MLCFQAATAANDDPAGTAAQFASFVLLEHHAPWTANAADDAVQLLPPAAQVALAAASTMRAFATRSVHSRHNQSAVRTRLGRTGSAGYYLQLPRAPHPTDLEALANPVGSVALPEPLFAICTNGRRDRCCALLGRAIAVGLHKEFGDQVLEISHLGGHRYAGNMLVLPWGYTYGFLNLAGAQRVAEAASEQLVHPDGLRGRADLSPIAQAAEVLLRHKIGPASPAAVVINACTPTHRKDTTEITASVLGTPAHMLLHRAEGPRVGETACGGTPFETGRWTMSNY